jgi:hypothetical protein
MLWPSPAHAAPDGGASVATVSDCVTDDFGTFCYRVTSIANTTVTPSGNESFTAHEKTDYTFVGAGDLAGCNDQGSFNRETHILTKDGTRQEGSNLGRVDSQGGCLDFVSECTHTDHWHYADGRVQFDRWTDSCT